MLYKIRWEIARLEGKKFLSDLVQQKLGISEPVMRNRVRKDQSQTPLFLQRDSEKYLRVFSTSWCAGYEPAT